MFTLTVTADGITAADTFDNARDARSALDAWMTSWAPIPTGTVARADRRVYSLTTGVARAIGTWQIVDAYGTHADMFAHHTTTKPLQAEYIARRAAIPREDYLARERLANTYADRACLIRAGRA